MIALREREDGLIEVAVEQQDTGVCDDETKTEEIPTQTEVDQQGGQSDENLLEPKSDIEA